jgi:hypothetical protein
MWCDIHPGFTKIDAGFQAILKFCRRNLRGCDVRTADGRNFISYSVKMGIGAVISVISFVKIGSGIQKLIKRIHIQAHTHTDRQQGDLISLLYFFKIGKLG